MSQIIKMAHPTNKDLPTVTLDVSTSAGAAQRLELWAQGYRRVEDKPAKAKKVEAKHTIDLTGQEDKGG